MNKKLCYGRDALASIETTLQLINDVDIHTRSSQLLLLNGHTAKSDLQTHSRSSAIMPFDSTYMISYFSSIVTMSLSSTFSEIFSLIFENLKTSRDRKGLFVIPMLNSHLAN